MKIDKSQFINCPTLLSQHFLGESFDKLTKEEQDKLCNADELDIKMSINGVDIPFPTMEQFLQTALNQQFIVLLDDYLQEKYGNTFNMLQERISETAYHINHTMDDIMNDIEHAMDNFKDDIIREVNND